MAQCHSTPTRAERARSNRQKVSVCVCVCEDFHQPLFPRTADGAELTRTLTRCSKQQPSQSESRKAKESHLAALSLSLYQPFPRTDACSHAHTHTIGSSPRAVSALAISSSPPALRDMASRSSAQVERRVGGNRRVRLRTGTSL